MSKSDRDIARDEDETNAEEALEANRLGYLPKYIAPPSRDQIELMRRLYLATCALADLTDLPRVTASSLVRKGYATRRPDGILQLTASGWAIGKRAAESAEAAAHQKRGDL